jgi:hypothetical protein
MSENPGMDNVEDLLINIHTGGYVIPYFQRGYEWQPSMVCDLFESILQNYYAGLILLWELNPEGARHEEWEAVWGADLSESPSKAILDGQQRLASLYYAIYGPSIKFPNRQSYYLFFLNLNNVFNEEYEGAVTYKYYSTQQDWQALRNNRSKWAETGIIPLVILSAKDPNNPSQKYIDSTEFEDWVGQYLNFNKDKLREGTTTHKVYKILNGILNYTFVFYPLATERKLPDICNIFARVNAKGMKLSTFDLMNAFLYPKGVRLRKELWEGLDNDVLKRVDDNMNEYLLKLISLVKQNYCSSKYIYNLIPGEKTTRKDEAGAKYDEILVKDGAEFNELWKKACINAESARQIIMNTGEGDFGAIKPEFIPNTTIVPVLGAILSEYTGSPDDLVLKETLRKWYWSAVFSEDYSGASDSIMAKDFRDWKGWINNERGIERITKISREFVNEIDLSSVRRGSARYNAIISILALNDVKDFYKGRIVGTGDYSDERINDHHIFPTAVEGLDPEKRTRFGEVRDSIVNRTLLLDETNYSIRNKLPSEYIKSMIEKHGSEDKVKSIFQEHLINDTALEFMKQDHFDNFVVEREKEIKKEILKRLHIN